MIAFWTYLAVVSGLFVGAELRDFARCLDANLPRYGVFTVRFARPWMLPIEFGLFALGTYGMAVA